MRLSRERQTRGSGEQYGAARGGEVPDVPGQIRLVQVEEGRADEHFLRLLAATQFILSVFSTEQN
jgi:hypothetical protein